ncbi:MAG: hypothetical protein PHX34_00110 [Candidatus Shapirobacteria bacterium]|nr:hypothetical protein [Candidatus Shapirobacteria bacterium]
MLKKFICIILIVSISLLFIFPNLISATPGDVNWVKSTGVGTSAGSYFYGVTSDNNDNIYTVGQISSTKSFVFGNQTINGGGSGNNAVIVKYNSSGDVSWAKSTGVGTGAYSIFNDVAVDSNDNIYAVGEIGGTLAPITFDDQAILGGYVDQNTVIVKYNSSGNVQWAKSTSSGASNNSKFRGVAVDSNDNIYAVGMIYGGASFTFGDQTVNGSNVTYNPIIVKYNSSGAVQWARSVTQGPNNSYFNSVTIDRSGNIYAVGNIYSTSTFTFGNQTVNGGYNSGYNGVVVKYNSSGEVQWAKSTATGTSITSYFYGAATNNDGNIYVVGQTFGGTKPVIFGDETVTGGYNGSDYNPIIVEYNSVGKVAWVKSTGVGSSSPSYFADVFTDSKGNPYAVGYIYNTNPITFGDQSVNGGYSQYNSLIVKYNMSGEAQWAKSVSSGAPDRSYFYDVTLDSDNNIYPVGYITGKNPYTFSSQSINGGYNAQNATIVQYKHWDFTPPRFSKISGTLSNTTATINWTTDEEASSQIEYGITSDYGSTTPETDTSSRVINHQVNLNNLNSCTKYYYKVISEDASNNNGNSENSFYTTGCEVSTITNGSSSKVTTNGGSVNLNTNRGKATITAPKSYYSEDLSVQINKLDTKEIPTVPSKKTLIDDNFFEFSAIDTNGTKVATFDSSVTLVIDYGSDVEAAYSEESLDLYKYVNGSWVAKNCIVDTEANTLTCILPSFSTYSIFGEETSFGYSAPACTDSKPVLTPDLFQINAKSNTAKLFFTPSDFNQYYVSFSINPNAEENGELVTLTKEWIQSHTIYFLKPYTTYYIKVRGQNGCMPGDWSNIIKFTTDNSTYYKYFPKSIYPIKTILTSKTPTPTPTTTLKITSTPEPTETPKSPEINSRPPQHCFLWWCW